MINDPKINLYVLDLAIVMIIGTCNLFVNRFLKKADAKFQPIRLIF